MEPMMEPAEGQCEVCGTITIVVARKVSVKRDDHPFIRLSTFVIWLCQKCEDHYGKGEK